MRSRDFIVFHLGALFSHYRIVALLPNMFKEKEHFIKVCPPLPCRVFISDGKKEVIGFLTELSENAAGLTMSTAHGKAIKNESKSSIDIVYAEDKIFSFNVIWKDQKKSCSSSQVNFRAKFKNHKYIDELMSLLRKEQHIAICRDQDVEASDKDTGFDDYAFVPKTLPDLDWSDIDIKTKFLGKVFGAPFLIECMTGGIKEAQTINHRLASAASKYSIPFGVGSVRLAVDLPKYIKIFDVKTEHRDVFLIGNIGISQILQEDSHNSIYRVLEGLKADAIAVHLNVMQELVQIEGNKNFKGAIKSLKNFVKSAPFPVIAKEVGFGIDPDTFGELVESGVRAIDLGGKGGTSWVYVEGLRSSSESVKQFGRTFRDWGIPTAVNLSCLRELQNTDVEIVASGGIRDGLMAAKSLALGARMVGIGLPLFRAALQNEEAPSIFLEQIIKELKISMFGSGCSVAGKLKGSLYNKYK